MIKTVIVTNPKHNVYAHSWESVKDITKLHHNLNIITVGDVYSGIDTEVSCKRRLMIPNYVNSDYLSDSEVERIKQFILDLDGESVIVNCEYGRVRSKNLAEYIVDNFPDYSYQPVIQSVGVY